MLVKKIDSLFVKHASRIICLIIHVALIRITMQNPEEMPAVFEQ